MLDIHSRKGKDRVKNIKTVGKTSEELLDKKALIEKEKTLKTVGKAADELLGKNFKVQKS